MESFVPPPPDRPSVGETTAGSGGEKRPAATRETVKVLRFKYTDTKTLGVVFSPKGLTATLLYFVDVIRDFFGSSFVLQWKLGF
ncbi:Transcription factor tau 91 kDa subunit [Dissostichus eleginoides]|uniref:Transcription factor tau 91 kDa subunit n=1 Tax=Dissostichus eleginoides TaxID=100907 RepID=A0AAD9FJS9_DISEL|nr:Transcription factor tau 91 kDa subunit [Dissostichus eleginoides]